MSVCVCVCVCVFYENPAAVFAWNIVQQNSVLHLKPLCPVAPLAACQILGLPVQHFGGLSSIYLASLCCAGSIMCVFDDI